ncbi:MAG: PAS domain S-box protein, partial [bacterium]|nr:PAS domain S-box protein [bacterium]
MPEQSSEQLRTILDAAPLPLLISRLSDGKILYANQHLAALVDMVPEQMLGKDTPDFYADPADRAYVMGLLEKDEHLSGFEMRVKTSRGRVIWMILSAAVTEMDGQPVA